MTPESLLRTHQDGVYTVCLHVLGNSHDAEDAAQEALLKISAEASGVQEPRAFKSWIYRVTYRTALDHLRKRATRRRIEEGSVPMTPSLTEEQREAIHEAMAALPDDDRLMLVEHYFEKIPFSELGRREGISDVAMGKRVEKAREKLKRGLAGAGILVAASQVTHALESVQAATAPKAALVAAGGTVVGSKSGIPILVALALLFGVGGGAVWYLGRESPNPGNRAASSGAGAASKEPPATSRTVMQEARQNEPDIRTCRSLLAGLVTRIRSNDVYQIAWQIPAAHDGHMPEIEKYIREFMEAAGDQVLPFSRKLLAETESEGVRMLIALVLGRTADPASLDLLKGMVTPESSVPIQALALYSAALQKTPDSLAFIQTEWERMKKEGGPLGLTLALAVGIQGPGILDWLLAELKNSNLKKLSDYQGVPWSFSWQKGDFLARVRGPDALAALRRIYESEPDPDLKSGAVRGMLANVDSSNVEYLTQVVTGSENAPNSHMFVHALRNAPKSTARTELVDRILTEIPYPSGNLELDRSLVRLVQIASPEKAVWLFERFMAVAPSSKDEQLFWNVGAMYQAAANMPEGEARIAALMKAVSFSPQQESLVFVFGLYGAGRENAASLAKPVLQVMRTCAPASDTFANCLNPLLNCGLDERVLSEALLDMSTRQTDPVDRLRILQELMRYSANSVTKTTETTFPRTFLMAAADQAREPESLLCAVHALASSGSESLTRWRKPLAEWIGRDMKWIDQAGPDTYLSFVAPMVIGDYYARFGNSDDATWLKDLPSTFPYPASWKEDERSRLRSTLKDESRRAIDAIRLRN